MARGWLFPAIAGALGYQFYGTVGAIVSALAVMGLTAAASMIYLARVDHENRNSVSDLRRIKWGVFIAAAAVIVLTGIQTGSVWPPDRSG